MIQIYTGMGYINGFYRKMLYKIRFIGILYNIFFSIIRAVWRLGDISAFPKIISPQNWSNIALFCRKRTKHRPYNRYRVAGSAAITCTNLQYTPYFFKACCIILRLLQKKTTFRRYELSCRNQYIHQCSYNIIFQIFPYTLYQIFRISITKTLVQLIPANYSIQCHSNARPNYITS